MVELAPRRTWLVAIGLAALLACLLAAPLSARAAELKPTSGSVTMVSEAGDYIGQGTDRLFDSPGTISWEGGLGGVRVDASGEAGEFHFEFEPPKGSQLHDGDYLGAQRAGFQPAGVPGLDVGGEGRGCNNSYGRFIVKDIEVNSSGELERFWALYEQHCEGPHDPPMFGEVRVGEPSTAAAETVAPAAIDWPDTYLGRSAVEVPVTVMAGKSGAHITNIALEGEDPGEFSISSDGCDGTVLAAGGSCQLDAHVKPMTAGAREAELVITDASGVKTAVRLAVLAEVRPENSVTMVSESSADWVGKGLDYLFDEMPGTVYASGGLGGVDVKVSGEAGGFSLEFVPPSGSQLEDGEYAKAQRAGFAPNGLPGLSVGGDGRGCNTDYGRFIVKDIGVDSAGEVDRFWALFDQHCEAPEDPALFGEVRIGEPPSSAPESVYPVAVEWPDTAAGTSGAAVPVTVVSGLSGAHVTGIALEGPAARDFSISDDGCVGVVLVAEASCALEVHVKPTTAGVRTAQLVISDASGAETTVALSVTAHGQAPAPSPPTVTTEAATAIDQSSATLHATVNLHEAELTACEFEYGTTTSYGSSVPCATVPASGGGSFPVTANLSGLQTDTRYHYRIAVMTAGGTSVGLAETFNTLPAFAGPGIPSPAQAPGGGSMQPAASPASMGQSSVLTFAATRVPAAVAQLVGRSLLVSRSGSVSILVSCPVGVTRCFGTVTLRSQAAHGSRGSGHRSRRSESGLTLASGHFDIAGGHRVEVRLRLSASARALLAHAHTLHAQATIVSNVTGADNVSKASVTLHI
jgi:hypothetical protein